MKKYFGFLVMAVISAFTFTSCEDVPAPYHIPTVNEPDAVVIPVGTGTLADPYNVTALQQAISSLASGETTETLYFKGIVSSIKEISASYGNATFYISDNGKTTNQFYIYRALGLDNKNVTSDDLLHIGDTVMICGKVTNYNGTLETVQKEAYIYSINAGGNSNTNTNVTSSSTKDEPLSVAGVKNASGNNYVKGYIVGYIPNATGMKLENVVFEVPTDASNNTNIVLAETADETDYNNCVPVALPSGDIRTALNLVDNAQLKGLEVLIYGSCENYFGTKGVKSVTWAKVADKEYGKDPEVKDEPMGEAQGDGTQENPYNVAGALTYIRTLTKDDKPDNIVYTEGKISQVVKLGNSKSIQFKMSDDGTTNNELLVYYCNNLGNVAFEELTDLKVGDEVVVCGKVVNYNGNTPEYNAGAYLYSLNGKTEVDSEGDGNGEGDGNNNMGEGMSIGDLPSDITTNAYGTQTVADESTWINWTWNGVQFAGCKVCNAGAISGTIQMQGNASDAAKMGFIFNKTAWAANINKITLVLKVNSTYDPAYTLYAGSEAHPTTGDVTPTSTMTEADGIKTYTQVFDLSGKDAKFFTIHNNRAGALYVEKIVVE